jgi:hypothetical protein
MALEMKRKSTGVYESTDGRVVIELNFDGGQHRGEWSVHIDGACLARQITSKRSAVEHAETLLDKIELRRCLGLSPIHKPKPFQEYGLAGGERRGFVLPRRKRTPQST